MIKMIPPIVAAIVLGVASPAIACGDGSACGVCETKESAAAPAKNVAADLVTETFAIATLKCDKCAKGVSNALSAVEGVAKVEASREKGTVTVTFAKGKTDIEKLNAALKGHFKLSAMAAKPVEKTEQKI
jgi:copper chaperone CopZ